jgi:hypothetical protein
MTIKIAFVHSDKYMYSILIKKGIKKEKLKRVLQNMLYYEIHVKIKLLL